MNTILIENLHKNDPYHALFIVRENRDQIDPRDQVQLKYI